MEWNRVFQRSDRCTVPILVAWIVLASSTAVRASAATPPGQPGQPPASLTTGTQDEIAELREEIEALRTAYEARIDALERRLAELEAAHSPADAAQAAEPDDELAALRAAAAAAAGAAEVQGTGATAGPTQASSAPSSEATTGRGGNLSALNPEISVTGVFLGRLSENGRDEFDAEEFEVDLQAALDPFSRMRLTLALHGEEAEIEEGWVQYSALPGGLDLLAGRFRQRFGALNRQHLHALPQTDYPLPLQLYLGDEGLAQTGVSLTWLLPKPWADANELTLEITDGDGEAFAGEDFEQLSLLAHVKNFWDLSNAAYLELGLSGVAGEGPEGDLRRIYGADLTYHWQPPARARYRELTWRSEVLRSERESLDPSLGTVSAWGAYTYLEGLVRQNLYLGIRLDGAEHPDAPSSRIWGVAPYITWWQSEFVRLRTELRHQEDELLDTDDNQLVLQLSWAAGPHKHETY